MIARHRRRLLAGEFRRCHAGLRWIHAGAGCGPICGACPPYAICARHRSAGTHTLGDMTKLDAKQVTRTLTIELPESEWAALRSVEPDAIGWLQGRIRERLQASGEAAPVSQFENAGAHVLRHVLGRGRGRSLTLGASGFERDDASRPPRTLPSLSSGARIKRLGSTERPVQPIRRASYQCPRSLESIARRKTRYPPRYFSARAARRLRFGRQ